MRVVLVSNTSIAMVWFRLPLLRELVARGHQVTVLAPAGEGVDRIEQTGARFVALKRNQGWAHDKGRQRSYVNPMLDVRTVANLARVLRGLRPDLLLAYTPKMSVLCAIAGRAARVPRIHGMWTGLGYAALGGGRRKRAFRRVYRAAMRLGAQLSDSVILLNRDNLDEAIGSGMVPAAKAFWIDGEGVDTERFDAEPPTYEVGRATFLSVGRLVAFKGAPEFVEAARMVHNRFPEARFVVAGGMDTSHPAAISARTLDEWREEGIVEVPGHVTDIVGLLRDADVFVLPSHENEGLPMSIMEAMAMSRPILTTAVPGNRETVEDGVNGHLLPPRDPAALAARMEALLADPSLGYHMGVASRTRCLERFSAPLVNDVLLAHLGL